ncbi:MAG: 3-keto-disaccharide hydrolase, partial [Sphingobacterium sp.]
MKNQIIICFVAFLAYSFGAVAQSKQLFNGKDLTGWTVHGTEKWYVEKNELVCESGPDKQYGYLSTNTGYKDFELNLQFKLEANGNSGVFIRSDIDGLKIKGWQVEVAPPGAHTGGIYESYGRGWLVKPGDQQQKALKPTDWNTMRIVAKGNKITTWLNGKQMVQLDDQKIGEADGFIALQI